MGGLKQWLTLKSEEGNINFSRYKNALWDFLHPLKELNYQHKVHWFHTRNKIKHENRAYETKECRLH